MYHIREFNTSKIHYYHEVECDNLKVKKTEKELKREELNRSSLIDKMVHIRGKVKTLLSSIHLTKYIHGVLTFNKVDSSSSDIYGGCINRDKNSVLNMNKLIKNYLKTGKRIPLHKKGKRIKPLPPKKVKGNDG